MVYDPRDTKDEVYVKAKQIQAEILIFPNLFSIICKHKQDTKVRVYQGLKIPARRFWIFCSSYMSVSYVSHISDDWSPLNFPSLKYALQQIIDIECCHDWQKRHWASFTSWSKLAHSSHIPWCIDYQGVWPHWEEQLSWSKMRALKSLALVTAYLSSATRHKRLAPNALIWSVKGCKLWRERKDAIPS